MKNIRRKSLYWVIIIFFTGVIIFIALITRLVLNIKSLGNETSEISKIKEEIQKIQNAVLYNESNTKSYLINTQPFLEELIKDVPILVKKELSKLRNLKLNDHLNLNKVDSLAFFLEKRINFTQAAAEIRKKQGIDSALKYFTNSEISLSIAASRRIFNQLLDNAENELQENMQKRQQSVFIVTVMLLIVFFVLIMLGAAYINKLITTNIQKNKQLENARYIEKILDSISDAVIITNLDFKITHFNKVAEEMYGLKPGLTNGSDFDVAVRSQSPIAIVSKNRRELKSKGFWKGEAEHLNAAGLERVIESYRSALYDKDGVVYGFVISERDITDKKIAENLLSRFNKELSEKVNQKTAELTSVLERISDAFIALDKNWFFTYINPKAGEILGKAPGYLLGKNAWKEFPEGVNQAFYKMCHKALEEQKFQHLEEFNSATTKWFEYFVYPSLQGLSVFFRDISDKMAIEKALKQSEEKYRTLIEQASSPIIVYNKVGKLIEFNEAALLTTGYSKQDIFEMNINDFLFEEDIKRNPIQLEELLNGNSVSDKRRIRKKDGSAIIVELHSRLISTGNIIAVATDVTEKERFHKMLSESEEKYRTLVQHAAAGIFLQDKNGYYIDANEYAYAITGYSQQELSHMCDKILLFESDEKTVLFKTEDMSTGEAVIKEGVLLKKDNTTIAVEVSAKRMDNGIVISILRDITERKSAEEKIRAAGEQLRQYSAHLQHVREEERIAISREIHDELGQYLTVMKIDISWLQKNIDPQDHTVQQKISEIIYALNNTVDSIRRISTDLRPSILDDLGLVAALDWYSQDFSKSTGIKTKFQTDISEIEIAPDVATSLFRIFQESFTNVAKHAEATFIYSRLEINDELLQLTIQDNGKGFSPESVRNKKTLGILGMRERANIFKGQLNIQSIPGEGTTIEATVPFQILIQ